MNKIVTTILFILVFANLGLAEEHLLKVEKINIDDSFQLREKFDYAQYEGVLRSQQELDRLWSNLINVKEKISAFNKWLPWIKGDVAPSPRIDFNSHEVIWFADRGINASGLNSISAMEFSDKVKVYLKAFFSDYGSDHLNLWEIPKTDKKVVFEESREYDQGP